MTKNKLLKLINDNGANCYFYQQLLMEFLEWSSVFDCQRFYKMLEWLNLDIGQLLNGQYSISDISGTILSRHDENNFLNCFNQSLIYKSNIYESNRLNMFLRVVTNKKIIKINISNRIYKGGKNV